jgi:hypothetical protein
MKHIQALSATPLQAIRDFDWQRLKRYADPQAMKDLDQFLDNLPQRAGKKALITACSVWFFSAVALFLVFHNAQSLKDIQTQLAIAEGTRVAVPQLTYTAIDARMLKPLIEKLKKIYPSLIIGMQDGNAISVKASTTRDFSAWRAAIGDASYGAHGWKSSVKMLCAGRACKGEPLQAVIAIQNIDIRMPDIP